MVTQALFTALCALIAAQRLGELRQSKQNDAELRARGARERGSGHFATMRALHAGFFLAACAEVWLLERPLRPALALAMLAVFGLGQLLRLSARRALGARWSVRILTQPGAAVITSGPYRYLRHPNYLGVALEIAALPLVHGAWLTAIVFSLANGLLLAVRIRQEEAALSEDSDYAARFANKPRFLPRWSSG